MKLLSLRAHRRRSVMAVAVGVLLTLMMSAGALADDYICGDADANTLVDMADAQYLMNYIFAGGPAPLPVRAADANGTGTVNIADVVTLVGYDVNGTPEPCNMPDGYLGVLPGNEVIINCPVEVDVPTEIDTIAVGISITNDVPLGGFSLGFHYDSDLIEVVGIDTTGSTVSQNFFWQPSLINQANNTILIGWADFSGLLPTQPGTNHFLASLLFEVPAGVDPHCINIDSTFVPPAGTWTFSAASGSSISPGYVDCDWDVVIGGAECPTANELPTAVCQSVTTGADANCEADVSVDGGSFDSDGTLVDIIQRPPAPYPLGTTDVWLVVTDDLGGMDSCQTTVTVNDLTDPVPTCPGTITVGTDPGVCNAVVDFSVGATDNCQVQSVVATPASGSVFPKGTTSVEVVATDMAGNTGTCSFDVVVNDNEDPALTCPGNIEVDNDAGQCGAVVNFAAVAEDNCPGVTVATDPASDSFFDVGETTVTVTATDASGNTSQCTFTVTVNDVEDPVAICPGNIEVPNDPGEDGAVVSFSLDVTDNCPGATVSSDPASGFFFPLGTTSVLVTATDGAGNTGTCSFDVTVNEVNNAPVALDTTVNTTVDTPVGAQMQGYDPDGDPITYSLDAGPENGSTSGFDANTGMFTYTPNAGYQGKDSVEFHVDDGSLPSNQAFVFFNIGGAGEVVVIPPEQYVYYINKLETYYDTLYFGNLPSGYTASDVDLPSVTINGFTPTGIEVIPSYPDFVGEVVCAYFPIYDLVGPWLPLFDTTMQEVTVAGQYTDMNNFSLLEEVTVYGKKSVDPGKYIVPPDEIVIRGDVDKDGIFNISDVIALVWFIFGEGEAPLPRMVADVDCNYIVNITDGVYMINYIFNDGPPPCPPQP